VPWTVDNVTEAGMHGPVSRWRVVEVPGEELVFALMWDECKPMFTEDRGGYAGDDWISRVSKGVGE